MQRSSAFGSRSSRADSAEEVICRIRPSPNSQFLRKWAAHSVLRPGQDGNIWFTEGGGNKIGRITWHRR
jgi:hypothetical protein